MDDNNIILQKNEYAANNDMVVNQPKTSTLAIVSLVCSIIGLCCCVFLLPLAAIITGYLGKKEIDESGGALTGEGLAIAGIVIGVIGIIIDIIFIVTGAIFELFSYM